MPAWTKISLKPSVVTELNWLSLRVEFNLNLYYIIKDDCSLRLTPRFEVLIIG